VYAAVAHRALLARLALACLVFWWLVSNLVLLAADEQAYVTRFGRYETTLEAGLHWRWPAPFERVRREKVERVRAVQLGFRTTAPAASADGRFIPPIEWQAEHKERGYMPVPAESALLAGDETALELTAEAQFRIGNLRQYVESSADAEAIVRAAAECAVRQAIARRPLEGPLSESRSRVEAECLALVREAVERYALGVAVVDFALLDVHPPTAVVPAYRDVANALEEQEQAINVAQAEYARLVLTAGGERALHRLSRAAEPADADRADARTGGRVADWKLTDALWSELTADEGSGETLLSGQAAARLLDARREETRTVEVAQGRQARFLSLLPVVREQPLLSRFQLYWETLEQVLSARPLTILDPRATGRQHLFLADPERFNLRLAAPAGIAEPDERSRPPETK
jgi:regulator of protease activity HflC (stomatin/prohibitin superfamily)